MNRMHVSMKVDDLEKAMEFYTRLFGVEPTLRRPEAAAFYLSG